MANRDIMLSCLKKHTFPLLLERGFVGKRPHFRRIRDDCIELISFQTNSWGGSFTVEISAAFPDSEQPNFTLSDGMTLETLNVATTNERYRLPGMFDGWFYYSDVYRKRTLFFGNVYHNVSEKEAAPFFPPRGYKLVQKFSETTAADICSEVNRQLEKAFVWLEGFENRRKQK